MNKPIHRSTSVFPLPSVLSQFIFCVNSWTSTRPVFNNFSHYHQSKFIFCVNSWTSTRSIRFPVTISPFPIHFLCHFLNKNNVSTFSPVHFQIHFLCQFLDKIKDNCHQSQFLSKFSVPGQVLRQKKEHIVSLSSI